MDNTVQAKLKLDLSDFLDKISEAKKALTELQEQAEAVMQKAKNADRVQEEQTIREVMFKRLTDSDTPPSGANAAIFYELYDRACSHCDLYSRR